MKALNQPFTKLINGTTQFVIPVFQRDYNWTETQCDRLWRDILTVAADPSDRGHFLGSVVYISTDDSSAGFTRWMLVDGQQRVTTLTLLLTALRDHISEIDWHGDDNSPTAKRINAYFLKNSEEEGGRIPKLVLRRRDQATLWALLTSDAMPAEVSERIRDNYDFFREKLQGADPTAIYSGIGRLIVVDVTLDRAIDDPQLIFESLNSTGMDLSQSDLIRNFILMRLQEKDQTRLYETYWEKIEHLFRGNEKSFDSFIRDYIALRTKVARQEKADEIYFAFRREFGAIGSDPEELEAFLQELLRFAGYNAAFTVGVGGPEALREPLARLRRLVDVPATVVMTLFECHDRHRTLPQRDFIECLRLLESYIFRRAICGEQTRGYWQIFAGMAYRMDKTLPRESLSVQLALQRDNYRFPADDEFRTALEERDIYGKRVCFELLDRLENADTNERSDTSEYSIEHIMPQNPTLGAEWQAMLGENWREIQRTWLHRLGNLTLTGYNSKYSDRPFSEKKTIPGGFAESAVRLNKFVREQIAWTTTEMASRGTTLAVRALSIWPELAVEQRLVDAAKQAEKRSLAERRDVAKVPMSDIARALFDVLRYDVLQLDDGIIEIAGENSISYHGPGFFLEVLPRTNRLSLLLPLDFNEIEDPLGIAEDASQRKFFVNAEYEGGVYIPFRSVWGVESILPMIRQARELART